MSKGMKNSTLRPSISRFKNYMHNRHGVLPVSATIPDLEAWLDNPFGQELLRQEQQSLDRALGCLFGYHLMQMSVSRKLDLTRASKINHRFSITPCVPRADSAISGRAEFDCLPLPEESIDVSVLHHVLEYSQSPHQLLREVSRVMIPRGRLVIVGFNPWSLIGSYKPFAQLLSRRVWWRYHSLRLGRLLDWLRLLDFEPVSIEHGFYRPPLLRSGILKRLGWMDTLGKRFNLPSGGYYCVVARKEIAAMTPIRPVWQKLAPIVRLTGTKASTRVVEPVNRITEQRRQVHIPKAFEI